MVGNLILNHCLTSSEVDKVTSLVRRKSENKHTKLKEVIIKDFTDYSEHTDLFKEVDAAYFCIGVYTGQVEDDKFKEITINYAFEFAKTLKANSPKSTLCLLSGAGADRTEKSSTPFAKYKGIVENRISGLGLDFYAFRPGYIYPVTPRKEPNLMYRLSRMLYPLIKMMGSSVSIKSTELARAMFKIGIHKADTEILENRKILEHV